MKTRSYGIYNVTAVPANTRDYALIVEGLRGIIRMLCLSEPFFCFLEDISPHFKMEEGFRVETETGGPLGSREMPGREDFLWERIFSAHSKKTLAVMLGEFLNESIYREYLDPERLEFRRDERGLCGIGLYHNLPLR